MWFAFFIACAPEDAATVASTSPVPVVAPTPVHPSPPTSVAVEKRVLASTYVSEGVTTGDVNGDGAVDVIAGTSWWAGPEFAFRDPADALPLPAADDSVYADTFLNFTADLGGGPGLDMIQVRLAGRDARGFIDFEGGSQPVVAVPALNGESPIHVDVIDDAAPELVAIHAEQLVLGIPGTPYTLLPITPVDARFGRFVHGLGAGDVNGDGRTDVVERRGWWEQPASWDRSSPWTFHPQPFAPGRGGAQMGVFDVDGDGDADIVTALDGHGYGLVWHEQTEPDTFAQHSILPTHSLDFSQLHALAFGDIDGDGVTDIVTGKCVYAHNGTDHGALDPAVLYWFQTVRDDAGAHFVPHRIDDASGVGRQIALADLNADGRLDVAVSNKLGVAVFLQTSP